MIVVVFGSRTVCKSVVTTSFGDVVTMLITEAEPPGKVGGVSGDLVGITSGLTPDDCPVTVVITVLRVATSTAAADKILGDSVIFSLKIQLKLYQERVFT